MNWLSTAAVVVIVVLAGVTLVTAAILPLVGVAIVTTKGIKHFLEPKGDDE